VADGWPVHMLLLCPYAFVNKQETFEDGLIKLRKHERSEVDKLVKIAQSHWNVANKNVIVLKILDYLCGSDGIGLITGALLLHPLRRFFIGAFLLEEDRNLLKQLASLTQKENRLLPLLFVLLS
jgi:hypothetical protein